jgi:hypothetical protein
VVVNQFSGGGGIRMVETGCSSSLFFMACDLRG